MLSYEKFQNWQNFINVAIVSSANTNSYVYIGSLSFLLCPKFLFNVLLCKAKHWIHLYHVLLSFLNFLFFPINFSSSSYNSKLLFLRTLFSFFKCLSKIWNYSIYAFSHSIFLFFFLDFNDPKLLETLEYNVFFKGSVNLVLFSKLLKTGHDGSSYSNYVYDQGS